MAVSPFASAERGIDGDILVGATDTTAKIARRARPAT